MTIEAIPLTKAQQKREESIKRLQERQRMELLRTQLCNELDVVKAALRAKDYASARVQAKIVLESMEGLFPRG